MSGTGFFFLSGVFFTDTDDSQDSRGMEGTIFYSTLPLPPAHEHWDIYLQLWLSRIFNCNTCVYQTATRWDLPPYRITIWVIDWWCNVCLFTWWIDIRFLLQRFDIGNRWIELALTITLALQANRLTNPSLWLVESEFSFSRNSILLFTVFLSSGRNHY